MNAPNDQGSPVAASRPRLESAPTPPIRRRSARRALRLPLMVLVPLIVLAAVAYFYATGGRYVSTDDAYVQAARVWVSSDVAGRVVALEVHDNQRVQAGQVLFRIDDRPYRIAVANAKAQLESARLQVQSLQASYRQKQAELKADQETLAYQQRELDRQGRLRASGATAQTNYDQAAHAVAQARQAVAATEQQIAGILAQLGGQPDLPVDQHPTVLQAQAALDRAELNLSYTTIEAPEAGVATKVDQLQVGDYVTVGNPVFSLVSTQRVWIEANFKETELTHMQPGQTATVDIDTYPDRTFDAKVVSLSPGTGSSFALLPPENATGNWVKVVQRVPVRLVLEGKAADDVRLHSGLSATVEVDTHYERGLLRLIESAWATVER